MLKISRCLLRNSKLIVDMRVHLLMQGDDPIACLNKAMAFLTAVASSRFPSTNNQLRTSSNPSRNPRPLFKIGGPMCNKYGETSVKVYWRSGYKSNATSSWGK
ncbi:hypothetical protein Tco_0839261 [Tanacetum coccineum]|uniref:Uncharacterized protein n=1 Tax=Tanacetum coccineum TaxID=301880 RepID=A0ABQ5AUM6_9ASTR